MDLISLAAWRTLPALLMYLGLLVVSGQWNELLHLPSHLLLRLLLSTLVGLAVGDLFYFRSMKLIGLARGLALSAVYPFFTLILALLFLGERPSWAMIGGAALIAGSVYLLAFPRGIRKPRSSATEDMDLRGVALALLAAVCWSVSIVILRGVLLELDVVLASSVRQFALVTILFATLLLRGEIGSIRKYGLRSLGTTMVAGIIGNGLGSLAFLTAVQRTGAAKTSILTSTMPLFAVPFSIMLREKLNSRVLLGIAAGVLGVWLTL